MIVLIDLDGTLTNTVEHTFKPMKDGIEPTVLNRIPVFDGAVDCIKELQRNGHIPIIASDSHPNYVSAIAENIFQVDYISLCDKPNSSRIINHLKINYSASYLDIESAEEKDSFVFIGDSWLDVEVGRRLGIRTILTKFYKTKQIEERDGIGQDWKPVKSGPTYFANSFQDILNIIKKPLDNLLAIEAIFQGKDSDQMTKFLYRNYEKGFTAFRCLARQEDGECDRFARADMYYKIDHIGRERTFIEKLAKGISNYLKRVERFPEYQWHYITYVADKKTTKPPNKLKEIFDLVNTQYEKIDMFQWSGNIEGKLRQQPDYTSRRQFISKYLKVKDEIDVHQKNIIVIDDQFTSSATANEISYQLREKGANNILFVAMFYLILPVESKACPKCGQALKIKIRKSDGNKFYSCVPPKYKGQGCGYTENIT